MGSVTIGMRLSVHRIFHRSTIQSAAKRPSRISTSQRTYSDTRPREAGNRHYNTVRHEDEFDNLVSLSTSSRRPLLTFWSTAWCASCKAVRPLLTEMIESGVGEEQGGVGFAEVQLDSPTLGPLAMRYGINSMPTLLSFSRGEPQLQTRVVALEELKSRVFLKQWIEKEAKRGGSGGAGGSGQGLLGNFLGG